MSNSMTSEANEEQQAKERRFMLQCMIIAGVMFCRLVFNATKYFLVRFNASVIVFTVYYHFYDAIAIADMLSDSLVYYKLNKGFRSIVREKFGCCCVSNSVVPIHGSTTIHRG